MIIENLKSWWKSFPIGRHPGVYSGPVADLDNEPDTDSALDTELEMEVARGSYRTIESGKLDRLFKYCFVVALVLHFSLIAVIPYFQNLAQPSPLLKQGEKVTQVRLVEPQESEKPPEPPPKEASAISDRDHTAPKEKIPKIPPTPKAPIGRMDARDQRMASLAPPATPEDLIKPKKESQEKEALEEEPKKKNNLEKSVNINKKPDRDTPNDQPRPATQRRKNIDLRPTPQEMAKGLSQAPGPSDFFPDGDVEEAVVDINTREDKFYSYMLHLKKKIEGVWVYPSTAAKSGLGGSLAVEFSIAKDGQLLYVNLLDSSGHTILDESALRAIKSAAPYFPFPPRLQAKRLKIRANFIYITSNYLRNIM